MNLREIEPRIAGYSPTHLDESVAPRRAAVAIVLRGNPLEILYIRRCKRDGDPWSGQMAFPGGHREPEDGSDIAAAMREAHEEVGIDLARSGRIIGQLDDLQSVARGHLIAMAICPFVFALDGERPPLTLDPEEVDDAVWLPLEELANGSREDTLSFSRDGEDFLLPCWRIEGHCIWGLTYIMTHSLLQILGLSDGVLHRHQAFGKA